MVRVMIVEDSRVWGGAIAHQVNARDGYRVVAKAEGVDEALEFAARTRRDVVLVDLMLDGEDGLRFARVCRQRHPSTRVVIVTGEPTPWSVAEARSVGVSGYVLKDDLASAAALFDMLATVVAGRGVFSAGLPDVEGTRFEDGEPLDPHGLTAQEREIVRSLMQGLGTAEIALNGQTVRNKTTAIGRKLGVPGRLEIVAKALAERIVRPPGAPPDPERGGRSPPCGAQGLWRAGAQAPRRGGRAPAPARYARNLSARPAP